MGNNIVVDLKNIEKSYKKGDVTVPVLSRLDLQIEAKSFTCLMGPSGSGKTTLLNLIGALDTPDRGEVFVAGQELCSLSQSASHRWRGNNIGMIFQSHNLLPRLTARQNIEVPLLLLSLSRKERQRRIDTVLDLVQLTDREKHFPKELSGGQEQRVAIARAIVTDAAILLCDEPTGDLDRESAFTILQLLQNLRSQLNKTVVMVTHDHAASEIADRVVHLDKGQLVEEQDR